MVAGACAARSSRVTRSSYLLTSRVEQASKVSATSFRSRRPCATPSGVTGGSAGAGGAVAVARSRSAFSARSGLAWPVSASRFVCGAQATRSESARRSLTPPESATRVPRPADASQLEPDAPSERCPVVEVRHLPAQEQPSEAYPGAHAHVDPRHVPLEEEPRPDEAVHVHRPDVQPRLEVDRDTGGDVAGSGEKEPRPEPELESRGHAPERVQAEGEDSKPR